MANINFKTDNEVKSQAEKVFAELGMNTSQALNMFLRQVIFNQGIPFSIKLPKEPNHETLQAMNEVESGQAKGFESMDDLFAELQD